MPRRLGDSASLVEHIESLSFLAGALEGSGNAQLAGPVDAARQKLKALQNGQNEVGDLDWRLRGREHLLMLRLDPLVRQLEKIEIAYIATPEGAGWTPLFETSAANILGKGTYAERLVALEAIDQALAKPDCPEMFKAAGKRYHAVYKLLAALVEQQQQNDGQRATNQTQAVELKHQADTIATQTDGHLRADHPDDPAFSDAHYKPASKPKKREPKSDELLKQVTELTAQLAQEKKEKETLLAALAELASTVTTMQEQFAIVQAAAGLAPAPAPVPAPAPTPAPAPAPAPVVTPSATTQANPVVTGAAGKPGPTTPVVNP